MQNGTTLHNSTNFPHNPLSNLLTVFEANPHNVIAVLLSFIMANISPSLSHDIASTRLYENVKIKQEGIKQLEDATF